MEKHGWIKIHYNDVYGSFIGNKDWTEYPYCPTQEQIKLICNYADKFYNGKFYTEASCLRHNHIEPYSTYKVKQMDDIMLHEIFSFKKKIIMIILEIILALCLSVLLFFSFYAGEHTFDTNLGIILGVLISLVFALEVICISITIDESKPTALDVYRGNTELEITSVNGVPIDTIVVFKK